MYTAQFDGKEAKVFWNDIHVETWNLKVSAQARKTFLEHYLSDCKCLDCIVGGEVNKWLNKLYGIEENNTWQLEMLTRPEPYTRY